MYFPYLRGKQFELLALRGLAALPIDGSKISPIIGPLKFDTKSIITMVKSIPADVQVQLIVNPEHGEIKLGDKTIAELIVTLNRVGHKNVVPTFIISKNSDLPLLKSFLKEFKFESSGYSLIHLNQIAGISDLISLVQTTKCLFNIILVNQVMALKRSFPGSPLAYLSDPFNRQVKNSDYTHTTDENFSNDHLYYQKEGFDGYGDYLTIGSPYVEGGRLPWAVAIHLTYEDDIKNIRIRHFVSDSNTDSSDTAGKFSEALDKLIIFIDGRRINTIAANEFRDLHARGAFPGLGSVKKLSIMHHIELMQSLL